MTERIADLRSGVQTIAAAKTFFDEIAQRTLKLAALDAAFEKRVAKLKAEHNAATCDDRALLGAGGNILAGFIDLHKDLFQEPRKIKTSLGSFGLQAVSELVIECAERVKTRVLENGYDDCFEQVFKLIKPALKKRIEAGEKFPGAKIVSGDVAVYKVDKSLVDEARENA